MKQARSLLGIYQRKIDSETNWRLKANGSQYSTKNEISCSLLDIYQRKIKETKLKRLTACFFALLTSWTVYT